MTFLVWKNLLLATLFLVCVECDYPITLHLCNSPGSSGVPIDFTAVLVDGTHFTGSAVVTQTGDTLTIASEIRTVHLIVEVTGSSASARPHKFTTRASFGGPRGGLPPPVPAPPSLCIEQVEVSYNGISAYALETGVCLSDACTTAEGCGTHDCIGNAQTFTSLACNNDGVFDDGEECDDGNVVPNDGCSPDCTLTSNPCVTDCAATFDLDVPSWLNHEVDQYPITAPFIVEGIDDNTLANDEVCFQINRPYTVTGLWYLGGELFDETQLVPNAFPTVSTRFGADSRGRDWSINYNQQPSGPCFDRMAANVPNNEEWELTTNGCSTNLRRCFNPLAEDLPAGCTSSASVDSTTGSPTTVLECALFQTLLRPKHTDATFAWGAGMTTDDYSYNGHKYFSRFIYQLSGSATITDVQFITPYISVFVNSDNLLQGHVELANQGGDGVSKLVDHNNIAHDCVTEACTLVVDGASYSFQFEDDTKSVLRFVATNEVAHYQTTIPLTFVLESGDEIHVSIHVDSHNVMAESGPISLGIQSSLPTVFNLPTISGTDSICITSAVTPPTNCVSADQVSPASTFSIGDTLALFVPAVHNDLLELAQVTIELTGGTLQGTTTIITTVDGSFVVPDELPDYWNVQTITFEGTPGFTRPPTDLPPVYGVAFRLGVDAGQYQIKIAVTFDVPPTTTTSNNHTPKLHKLNQEESSLASSLSTTIPLTVRRSTKGTGTTVADTTAKPTTALHSEEVTVKAPTAVAIVPILGAVVVVVVLALGVFTAHIAKRKLAISSTNTNELTPTTNNSGPAEDPQIDLQL